MASSNPEQLNQWIRPEIRSLQPYQAEDRGKAIRLDANESPFDVPDEVKDEIISAFKQECWQRYPDPDCKLLKQAIAKYEAVNPAQILIGNGSDEVTRDIMAVYGGPGTKTVFPVPTFSMYRLLTIATGGIPVGIHLRSNWTLDMDSMLQEVATDNTHLVFIAAPNNPTGLNYATADLERIATAANGLVIIDEAYRLFADENQRALLGQYPNVIFMHTFSKSFSLAGMRVGYIIAHSSVIDAVNRVRLPYNVDSFAQTAARVALKYQKHWLRQAEVVKKERRRVMDALAACSGLTVYDSQANFILIKHKNAEQLKQALQQADIMVRGFQANEELHQCLRITIGKPEENEQLIKVIQTSLSTDLGRV